MNLALRIREARHEANISQVALAQLVNVDPATVYRWETGRARPQRRYLPLIADALGKPVEFFGDDPDPEQWLRDALSRIYSPSLIHELLLDAVADAIRERRTTRIESSGVGTTPGAASRRGAGTPSAPPPAGRHEAASGRRPATARAH